MDAPLKILLIDDDAIDALKRDRFDCALLDFRLPDGSNFQKLQDVIRDVASL